MAGSFTMNYFKPEVTFSIIARTYGNVHYFGRYTL